MDELDHIESELKDKRGKLDFSKIDFGKIDPSSPHLEAEFQCHFSDSDDDADIPESSYVEAGEYPVFQGFVKENTASFEELKAGMLPLIDTPSIFKTIIRKGDGPLLDDSCIVTIHWQVFGEDDEKPHYSTFRRGIPDTLPIFKDYLPFRPICLKSMRLFEISRFLVPPELTMTILIAEDESQGIPSDEHLYVEIEVLKSCPAPPIELQEQHEVYSANENRLAGNAAFKKGQYKESIRKYKGALAELHLYENAKNDPEAVGIAVKVNVNLAIAFNKVGDHEQAIERCLIALQAEPQNTKAYFNLGKAYRLSGNNEEAKKALLQGLNLASNPSDFANELQLL